MIIFLAGPIDYWWNENWKTPEHLEYMRWRDNINQMLVEAGHLVYRPHEAFKGAWIESAQAINLHAIRNSDLVINLRPPGIPAYGTEAEINIAKAEKIPVRNAPPGDYTEIADLLKPLPDPYGDVHRKSYSK